MIENCKEDFYFTEKLIDSFVTGTLPIYWGCPSIDMFFDINGIIVLDDFNKLGDILDNIDQIYSERLPYIERNFELAKKYVFIENNFLPLYLKNI